jgi:hypothetical protein
MTAKPVAHLLADLGVTKSHSRPQVSNENPYSESQFRPLSSDRTSLTASVALRTPLATEDGSSGGATTATATPASATTPPPTCTTAEPSSYARSDPSS